jgi:hypothetical protein
MPSQRQLAFWGGGIYNDGSLGRGTVLLNNILQQTGFSGGGIFNNGENSGSTTVTLNNCAFSDNSTFV